MEWYNEPQSWKTQGEQITVTADAQTDFWRKTHDDGVRDNGHFFYQTVAGDFVAEVKFSGEYQTLYDQAGLMIRLNKANWIKCGIEYVDGLQYASAVVTRDYSDWSVVPLVKNPTTAWVRATRHGSTIEAQYSLDGAKFTMFRQAFLSASETVQVGLMCAAPKGNGFSTTFELFRIHSL